jgi:hypothetical protein
MKLSNHIMCIKIIAYCSKFLEAHSCHITPCALVAHETCGAVESQRVVVWVSLHLFLVVLTFRVVVLELGCMLPWEYKIPSRGCETCQILQNISVQIKLTFTSFSFSS